MYNFDQPFVNEPRWQGNKWGRCQNGEIPMFVAVMDFMVPPPILDALKERLTFPSFGYDNSLGALDELPGHYMRKYGVTVERDWILNVLSVMPGVTIAARTAGGEIMYCTPMYSHIRKTPKEAGLVGHEVPMKWENGRYTFDFDAMEKAYTPAIKSFILCNPHNPIGRVYTREELTALVRWCKAHDMLLIADEIHCEFIFEGEHIPAFSICEEAKDITITVSSPNKICNMPRIPMAYVVIPNQELRERFFEETHGVFGRGEALNATAFRTAYNGSCNQWKGELLDYLRANRDYMEQRIAAIPELSVQHNEGTYLAWIDCRKLGLDDPKQFFIDEAKVIPSGGNEFGDGQCVRLNFGCPRSQLAEALDRMEQAIAKLR